MITNSVSSFLTDKASEWPGFVTLPKSLGTLLPAVKRPKGLFRLDGELPENARLRLYLPRFSGLSAILGGPVNVDRFRRHIAQEIRQREKELRAERREKGMKLPGREQLLQTSPFDSPRKLKFPVLPMSDEGKSRRIAPRVATRDVELRIRILCWLADFTKAYRAARQRLLHSNEKKEPAPLFPYGTNLLRTTLGVCCKPRPADCPVPQLA